MLKKSWGPMAAGMIGSLFEWYDFALFGYFASVIGRLYFPSQGHTNELIAAFGLFAVGFIARPLGGVVFGYIGDCWGRKKALLLTIFLMAFPTALIGVLPPYENMGIASPILLIILRILQGLSMGGNYSGAIIFITEHAPLEKRGLAGSFAIS